MKWPDHFFDHLLSESQTLDGFMASFGLIIDGGNSNLIKFPPSRKGNRLHISGLSTVCPAQTEQRNQ